MSYERFEICEKLVSMGIAVYNVVVSKFLPEWKCCVQMNFKIIQNVEPIRPTSSMEINEFDIWSCFICVVK